MIPKRSLSRLQVACLFLSGVLVLGIVQWSFLPLLVQSAPAIGRTTLEVESGHTAKFAAPFKALVGDLFGDGIDACVVPSAINLQRAESRIVRVPDAPNSTQADFSLTHRPLRAPPSA
jgi:hypothetical protein